MSDMRRAARALVETRSERFESLHPLEESKARLAGALERLGVEGSTVFTPRWLEEDGRAVLEARFDPSRRTLAMLKLLSLGMAVAVVASVWAVIVLEGPMQFALPLTTILGTLAVPFVALGLGSQRDAVEARLRRAIRVALQDEAQRMPPPQRWEDEEA